MHSAHWRLTDERPLPTGTATKSFRHRLLSNPEQCDRERYCANPKQKHRILIHRRVKIPLRKRNGLLNIQRSAMHKRRRDDQKHRQRTENNKPSGRPIYLDRDQLQRYFHAFKRYHTRKTQQQEIKVIGQVCVAARDRSTSRPLRRRRGSTDSRRRELPAAWTR